MLTRTPFDTMSICRASELKEKCRIPAFQRLADTDHIDNIHKALCNTIARGFEPKLTGCLVTITVGDTLYLGDGNHRLAAYIKVLADTGHDLSIYVQNINAQNDREAEQIFSELNNNLPVIQMPPGQKRSNVNDIVAHFYNKYKKLFKATPTGEVRRPNISKLHFERTIIRILGEGKSDIIETLEGYIASLNHKGPSFFKKANDSIKKVTETLEKADINGCRLGMVDVSTCLLELFGIHDNKGNDTHVRAKIGSALRIAVWDKYCGKDNRLAKCPFCDAEIRLENFHCAHDISDADGGDTDVHNLYPCCASCNLSMGRQRFETFMQNWRTIQ